MRSMMASAGSPSIVSATRPRTDAIRYGFWRSTTDSATRGSRATLRALRLVGCVKKTMRPSSRPAQIGTVCGEPSGRTVARWTKLGASNSARTSSASSVMNIKVPGTFNFRAVRAGVIVPVHGWAPFLAETLDAVLSQRPAPAAVVVVDDGSREPVALHPDHAPHCELVRRVPRGGGAAARAAGEAALDAGIELVASCDADDAWLPGKLAAQLEAIAAAEMCF